ncbi:hypothetical protein KAI32_03550 [Candidatus Pacearchaeota archaeon]|nr:hypothetical protein [Candidatus Pacearchaeota archaeon]
MRTEKRAQIWGLDILAGMVLFLIGLMIFFTYSLNQPGEAQDNFEFLFYDGKIIADNLMSPGYPLDWNSSNVITLGISSDDKINETKLERLYEMIYVENNYTLTKNILNTQYEYYFFLDQNMTINSIEVEGIGKPGTTKDNVVAKNLIKVTRFTIYQNKMTPFYIYIWEE